MGTDTNPDCVLDGNPGGPVNGQNWLATVTILTGDDLSMLCLSRGPTPCIPGGTLFTGGSCAIPATG